MNSDAQVSELQARVERLSPLQKRLLLERLKVVANDATSGGGKLVAFYQSREPLNEQSLRELCADKLPAHMVPQRFLHTTELALTNTGKLDRDAMRAKLWLTSADKAPGTDEDMTAARNEVEQTLSDIWCDVLSIDEISVFDNFFEVGGDSLHIIRILSRASKAGLSLKPDAIFSHPTIAELAQHAGASDSSAGTSSEEAVIEHGDLPLLPIQRWFFDVVRSRPQHWNQSYLLRVKRSVEVSDVREAAAILLAKHAGLRSCFFEEDGTWYAQIAESMEPEVHVEAVAGDAEAQRQAMLEASSRANAGLSLADGPLFQVLCFTENNAITHLNVLAHHLIVDAVSWHLILADLDQLLSSADAQSGMTASGSGTPLIVWAEALETLGDEARFKPSYDYWLAQSAKAAVDLPHDGNATASNTEGECEWITHTLSASRTEQLRSKTTSELRCTPQELLLSALVQVLARWTGNAAVTLDLEGHGREALFDDIDVSSTVGWCTTVFPVTFHAGEKHAWRSGFDALRDVKEQLRAVPENGLSHGVFRYASRDHEPLAQAPRSRVLFNYLGVESEESHAGSFTVENARFGTTRHASTERAYELELNAVVRRGELTVDWAFGPKRHLNITIDRLAQDMMNAVAELIDGERGVEAVISPTDFPMSGLDQSALDNLSSQLDDLDDE